MTAKSLFEVLNDAADLISPAGAWTQGACGKNSRGRPVEKVARAECFCLLGAIRAASGMREFHRGSRAAEALADDAIHFMEVGMLEDSVYPWNDAPGRTQSEVVTLLRDAAKVAAMMGSPAPNA